jgi:hypothetical protein
MKTQIIVLERASGDLYDGKLYTRSKKKKVMNLMVAYGATPDILVEAHPHIELINYPKLSGHS